MEREKQTYETPSGKKFELKTYLTARELREIRMIPMRFVKVGMKKVGDDKTGNLKDEANMQSYDAEHATIEIENLLITLACVSFDGSADNVLQRLLDGRDEDYQAVLKEAQKLNPTPSK